MKINVVSIFIWIVIPTLNFFIWMHFGMTNVPCDTMEIMLLDSLEELEEIQHDIECELIPKGQCLNDVNDIYDSIRLDILDTYEYEKYRAVRLAPMDVELIIKTYPTNSYTSQIRLNSEVECGQLFQHHQAQHVENCFAIFYAKDTNISTAIVRFDQNIDIYGVKIDNPDPSQIDKYSKRFELNLHNEGKNFPCGFFRKVPKERGRMRTREKLGTFLENFDEITRDLDEKLLENNIKKGDDLVVMVVNEGEIDLFLNFACSCKLHDISLNNVLVFSGNEEIIPMLEATGAMGLYHTGYASVSKQASKDYLDRVFVDMMWYKAFSVYLVLRKGINILFQDVDLVWFKDPMSYFHDFIKNDEEIARKTGSDIRAFFSDDGQRSMRYTPYYGNSGFYYMMASEKSEYFTWSIMIAMDSIQVLGSHQNVLTTRLAEGLAIGQNNVKILTLEEFPTGIMYHHNAAYMDKLRNHEINPYGFHMCWTQGKQDKLKYFRLSSMWYITDQCSSLDALAADTLEHSETEEGKRARYYRRKNKNKKHLKTDPNHGIPQVGGTVFNRVVSDLDKSKDKRWEDLSDMCCHQMDKAP